MVRTTRWLVLFALGTLSMMSGGCFFTHGIALTAQDVRVMAFRDDGTPASGALVTAVHAIGAGLHPTALDFLDRRALRGSATDVADQGGTAVVPMETTLYTWFARDGVGPDQLTGRSWVFRVQYNGQTEYLRVDDMQKGQEVQGDVFRLRIDQIGPPRRREPPPRGRYRAIDLAEGAAREHGIRDLELYARRVYLHDGGWRVVFSRPDIEMLRWPAQFDVTIRPDGTSVIRKW